jgi:S-adenosylmethionine-diacylglycerol 3-amino-3-carboxypropyl transferase
VQEAIHADDRPFDGMNLSDIFEYMTPEETAALGIQLHDQLLEGGRVSYWNMMVPRCLGSLLESRYQTLEAFSAEQFTQDRAFFYQRAFK